MGWLNDWFSSLPFWLRAILTVIGMILLGASTLAIFILAMYGRAALCKATGRSDKDCADDVAAAIDSTVSANQ